MSDCVETEQSPGLAVAAPPSAGMGRPLRGLVLWGSAWTLAGYGGAQGMRLAGNLVLTRLLAPEIFGVTAIVSLFLQALEMCSDVGIGSSIVRSPRGDEPDFLDTAWTIQVARGFLLWAGAILIAWPVAVIYGTPQLALLLPVGGLAAVAQGFCSTACYSSNRHLALGRLTVMELCVQAITIVATASLALVRPTVWALIGGGFLGALAKAILSFTLLPNARNRPGWEPSAAREILHFGKWLTLSTILTFLAGSGDRLILGYVLSRGELGVYSIAFFMSQAILTAVRSLANRIFFPLFSRLGDLDDTAVRRRIRLLQAALLAFVLPPTCALVIWGPRIIDFLYDRRYHEAGWMLRILAAGTIVAVVTANTGSVVLAKGNSFLYMRLLGVRFVVLLVAMLAGWWVGKTPGLIVGVALEPLVCYPTMALASRRYGAWMPDIDLAAVLGSAALIGAGLWVFGS